MKLYYLKMNCKSSEFGYSQEKSVLSDTTPLDLGNKVSRGKECNEMSIMKHLVKMVAKKKLKEIDRVLNYPVEMSEETLMAALDRHRDTMYGNKFSFESIKTPEKFRETVPLMDGQQMKPYFEMIQKNPNGKILTIDPVVWFMQTSGTTGTQKRLPATKLGIKAISKGTMLSWMGYLAQDEENLKLIDGKLITFGAGSHLDYIGEIPVGYATGVYSKFQNPIFQRLMNLPLVDGHDVFQVEDMELKIRCYAKLLVEHNVTGLQGITPLWLALVRRMQNEYGPWLLDEYRGTKHEARLRDAMDDSGVLNVSELWPNLRFLLSTGVSPDPYRKWISETLPDSQIWEMYGGSESYYGGQLLPGRGMQISPHVNYYEFIPESEIDEPIPETIPLSDIKAGNRYEIVITNSGGYYRYRPGDMLTITSTDPITMTDIGRRGKVTNLSGEKLSDAHVTRAIDEACRVTGAQVMDYTVVARVKNGLGNYVIAAMFKNDVDSLEFIHAYEDAMKKSNGEFRVVRETGALGATQLIKMQNSYYDAVAKSKHVQSKPVVLTTDTSVLGLGEAAA